MSVTEYSSPGLPLRELETSKEMVSWGSEEKGALESAIFFTTPMNPVLQDSGEKLVVAKVLLEREMKKANIPSFLNISEESATAARIVGKYSLIHVLLSSLSSSMTFLELVFLTCPALYISIKCANF